MQSLAILAAAQTARLMTLGNQANAPLPVREAALEGPRQRNAVLDWLCYDLAALQNHESAEVAPHYAAPGSVLLVQNSDHASLQYFADFDGFRAARRSGSVRTLTVAGGGCSALGAAAFARNVADAVDAPVLAVVSGYGLADMMIEAMGGMWWFAQMAAARSMFDPFDAMTRPHHSTFAFSRLPELDAHAGSFDVKTLAAMLAGGEIELLVGHSKGNVVISDALSMLIDEDPAAAAKLAGKLRVIQVSTRVALPEPFAAPITVMGEQDSFGEMNSDKDIATDMTMPGASHHTNTELPGHLDVTNAVAEALKIRPAATAEKAAK